MNESFKDLCDIYDQKHDIKTWKEVTFEYNYFCKLDELGYFVYFRFKNDIIQILIVKTESREDERLTGEWKYDTEFPAGNVYKYARQIDQFVKRKIKEIECARAI